MMIHRLCLAILALPQHATAVPGHVGSCPVFPSCLSAHVHLKGNIRCHQACTAIIIVQSVLVMRIVLRLLSSATPQLSCS